MRTTHPTLDQMLALGLAGMAAAYRQLAAQDQGADLSRDEWLDLMLDSEAAMRADRRLTNRLAAAKLRFVDACIEDIDFASRRGLDRGVATLRADITSFIGRHSADPKPFRWTKSADDILASIFLLPKVVHER